VFFQGALKFTYNTRNRSHLHGGKKNHNNETKKYRMINLFHLIRNKFMYVTTYSPNFAPPHFAVCGIPKNTPHGKMEGHTAYIYMLSVYPFRMELFFFFAIHKAHTFAWPDIFCKVWKRLGNAVPMGKLLFLPVHLRDVNVPMSSRTKFRLKVSCLFPCAVAGGQFVTSCKMKQFTRHKFRIKCNINFHHYFEDRPTQ
jgi:hypothetical protein